MPNDQLLRFQEFFGIKDPKNVSFEEQREEALSQIADAIMLEEATVDENPYQDGDVVIDHQSALSYSIKSDPEFLQNKLTKEREERIQIEQEIQKLKN